MKKIEMRGKYFSRENRYFKIAQSEWSKICEFFTKIVFETLANFASNVGFHEITPLTMKSERCYKQPPCTVLVKKLLS